MSNPSNNLVHDPFGMIMVGRNWGNEEYRFGFNGKENLDEIKGDDNVLDFGARIYDCRLGKWLSIDPMQSLQTSWSPYKAFYDNPIIFVDPDGKAEYLVTIFVVAGTGQSFAKIEIVDDEKVVQKVTSVRGTIDPHDTHLAMSVYDIYRFKTVTLNADGTVSESIDGQEQLQYAGTRSYWKVFRAVGSFIRKTGKQIDKIGTGGKQNGGYMFTSTNGGIDPTKFNAQTIDRVYNIDDIVTIMEAYSAAMGMEGWMQRGGMKVNDAEMYADFANYFKSIMEEFVTANPESAAQINPLIEQISSFEMIKICKFCYENHNDAELKFTTEDHGAGQLTIPKQVYDEAHKTDTQKNEE